MKGYLYYNTQDAALNRLFIEDLQRAAHAINIDLQLLIDVLPTDKRDFILFRHRDDQLAEQLEREGHYVINRSEVNRIANNKLKTFELATMLGIPTIPTTLFTANDSVPSLPFVLKTTDGHGGNEVFLIEDRQQVTTIVTQFENHTLIKQPFVESNAQDIRLFTIGNEVIGAVKRTGVDGFKSNYTLGGDIQKIIIPPLLENYARTITKALKSDYIGIDFLQLPDGQFLLNEIEDPVGARSLYKTHSFSVANKLMDYIKEKILAIRTES